MLTTYAGVVITYHIPVYQLSMPPSCSGKMITQLCEARLQEVGRVGMNSRYNHTKLQTKLFVHYVSKQDRHLGRGKGGGGVVNCLIQACQFDDKIIQLTAHISPFTETGFQLSQKQNAVPWDTNFLCSVSAMTSPLHSARCNISKNMFMSVL